MSTLHNMLATLRSIMYICTIPNPSWKGCYTIVSNSLAYPIVFSITFPLWSPALSFSPSVLSASSVGKYIRPSFTVQPRD
jgi:hypothetical protein